MGLRVGYRRTVYTHTAIIDALAWADTSFSLYFTGAHCAVSPNTHTHLCSHAPTHKNVNTVPYLRVHDCRCVRAGRKFSQNLSAPLCRYWRPCCWSLCVCVCVWARTTHSDVRVSTHTRRRLGAAAAAAAQSFQ